MSQMESRRFQLARLFLEQGSALSLKALVAMMLVDEDEEALLLQEGSNIGYDILLETGDGKKVIVRADAGAAAAPVGAGPVRELFGALCHRKAAEAFLFTRSTFDAEARDFARAHPELVLIDGRKWAELLTSLAGGAALRRQCAAGHTARMTDASAERVIRAFDEALAFDQTVARLSRAGDIPGIKTYLHEILPQISDLMALVRGSGETAGSIVDVMKTERGRLQRLRDETATLCASAPDADELDYLRACAAFFEESELLRRPAEALGPWGSQARLDELRQRLIDSPHRARHQICYE